MKKIIILIIRFYQKFISPLLGPCCRYSPTCSRYGIEAVERYGALRGSFMTIKRILRCNPFYPGGYDPVPDLQKKKRRIKQINYKINKK